jgi:hypothetical protein
MKEERKVEDAPEWECIIDRGSDHVAYYAMDSPTEYLRNNIRAALYEREWKGEEAAQRYGFTIFGWWCYCQRCTGGWEWRVCHKEIPEVHSGMQPTLDEAALAALDILADILAKEIAG